MSRRREPFDATRISVPDDERPTPQDTLLSVQQVNEMVAGAVSRHLSKPLHVVGEIGNLSRPASGHVYLTLKDATSELRAVMWRSTAANLRFDLDAGLEVVARGRIEVYAPRGTYQLMLTSLEPRGVGALELAFRQRCAKLEAEGLFDPQRKRPLPELPQRVGLITSPRGAAVHDLVTTFARRMPSIELLVFPVRVQGDGAAAEIAEAIELANRRAADLGGIDVLVVSRGGGSLEELWAFNEEIVARAIAASTVPIVSAVGHEVDVTISDLVADLRAATPSAAAELIAPSRAALLDRVTHVASRIEFALKQRLHAEQRHLDALERSSSLADPLRPLRIGSQLLDERLGRVRSAIDERRRQGHQQLGAMADRAYARTGRLAISAHATRLEQRIAAVSRAVDRWHLVRERRLGRARLAIEQHGTQPQLERARSALERRIEQIARACTSRLATDRARLTARQLVLQAADPQRLLERGFAIVRTLPSHSVLRSAQEVKDGQRLDVHLADGTVRVTADAPGQGNLFDADPR